MFTMTLTIFQDAGFASGNYFMFQHIFHGMGQSDLGLKPQLSMPLERLVTKSDPKKHPLPISPQFFMKGQSLGY